MEDKRVLSILTILVIILVPVVILTTSTFNTVVEPLPTTTAEPTAEPTPEPTAEPTAEPTPEPTPEPIGEFKLHQIDVGCANAYLIQTDEITIMIDGGMEESRNKVFNYLNSKRVSHVDVYIGTHWHGDHVQNLSAILEKYGDSSTLVYGPSHSENSKFPVTIGSYHQMIDGDVLQFGNLTIKCMGPYEVRQSGACNWDSLNFLMSWGNNTFLMTGDYVHSSELLKKHSEEIQNVDVLQFPHHGLKCEGTLYLSEQAFSWINPRIVLVPANSSKPSRAMATSIGSNATFYDNKSGNVVIISDGDDIRVITEK